MDVRVGLWRKLSAEAMMLQELARDWQVWRAAIHGVAKGWTRLSNWTELNWIEVLKMSLLFKIPIFTQKEFSSLLSCPDVYEPYLSSPPNSRLHPVSLPISYTALDLHLWYSCVHSCYMCFVTHLCFLILCFLCHLPQHTVCEIRVLSVACSGYSWGAKQCFIHSRNLFTALFTGW